MTSLFCFVVCAHLVWVNQAAAFQDVENKNSTCIAPPIILPSTISPTTHGRKVVIAHRGASAHLPEHSLPGYRLALEMNADYIEPDLVATKDGVLIAIHSMDLNVTTDVATKFPDRLSFSKFMNRTGYWSYEFTASEIDSLRLRQRLPEARSKAFDGIFQVPTFTSILELISEWNTEIEPVRINATYSRAKRGVYAELKDYPWLLEDTGVDLVQLMFHHIDENEELWQRAIVQHLCDVKLLKDHEYRLPPLVVQSFEGDALNSFMERWDEKFNNENATGPALPKPPAVLLVGKENCLEESFWFDVDEKWRKFLSGVGPDKACLGRQWRAFMERAAMSELAVHPWTARPELNFFSDPPPGAPQFESVLEEIQHMFCTVGVHGIFSESVDTAVLASTLPCPDPILPTVPSDKPRDDYDGICDQTDSKLQVYIAISSFLVGLLVAVACMCRFTEVSLKRNRQRSAQVPTVDVDTTHDDLQLDDNDMEML
eukprot:scaffold818_cov136-Cylindrotheca_fusiformis.AAC.19